MKLRPPYSPPLACPKCGALAEELGYTRVFPDDTTNFVPEPIEHVCKPDAPFAERRTRPGKVTVDKSGRESVGKETVYYVQVYSHECTRRSPEVPAQGDECGRMRPECGVLLRQTLRPYTGELPEWAVYPEVAS